MIKRIAGIALFVAAFLNAEAQLITVKSEFESDSAMIGEQINYNLTVTVDSGVSVSLPVYSDTISNEIEIISEEGIDTAIVDSRKVITASYKVTSFEPGWNTVPPQPVEFTTGTITDTAYTAALLLTVLAPAVDTTQTIKPIKPPQNTPVNFAEMFPWIMAGLGLAALIFLIIYFVRRNRNKKLHPELYQSEPLEPAHIIAFRDLDALEAAKLPQSGRVKEYYSRLTEIIRIYMSRLFNIHAMESTTAEILAAFNLHENTDSHLSDMLRELLMLADLVKFAKEDPLMEENQRHLGNARSFVEKTFELLQMDEEDETVLKEEEQYG